LCGLNSIVFYKTPFNKNILKNH